MIQSDAVHPSKHFCTAYSIQARKYGLEVEHEETWYSAIRNITVTHAILTEIKHLQIPSFFGKEIKVK